MVEQPAVNRLLSKVMTKDNRKYADRRKYLIEAVSKRRKAVRDKALEYKGGKCEICGYSKCVQALEFHHLDGNKKDFGVSSKGFQDLGIKSFKRLINAC
ncbi:MAG: hypothetical protein BWY53_00209 [Parcubacteria group bacterium ADurb.Bin326]|nr:MAG: hypothetical protein BWY53_00209 [Parcubacteria group bacterium ADurb.Bin326]